MSDRTTKATLLLGCMQSQQSFQKDDPAVQVRNERAVHLYKKLGFEIEGCQARGACSAEGEFLDVYLMGKLID